MADGHEPSMEEILSSIKRIIKEDSDATLSSPRVKRAVAPPVIRDTSDDDVLELTETAEPTPALIAPEPARTEAPKIETPKVETPRAAEPEAPATLVSPTTAEASRSSLAALSALIVRPEITGSDTLEGLVRTMLKPMLAEWLDARLPEIVERQVAQEIARISTR